jgi:hypothetical protein
MILTLFLLLQEFNSSIQRNFKRIKDITKIAVPSVDRLFFYLLLYTEHLIVLLSTVILYVPLFCR